LKEARPNYWDEKQAGPAAGMNLYVKMPQAVFKMSKQQNFINKHDEILRKD
jgi:hypothetical protein